MATMTNKKKTRTANASWENLVAGFSGGLLSTIILHPLDLVKVRFQG